MGVASSVFEAFLPKKAIRIRSSAYPRPTKRLTLTFTKHALSPTASLTIFDTGPRWFFSPDVSRRRLPRLRNPVRPGHPAPFRVPPGRRERWNGISDAVGFVPPRPVFGIRASHACGGLWRRYFLFQKPFQNQCPDTSPMSTGFETRSPRAAPAFFPPASNLQGRRGSSIDSLCVYTRVRQPPRIRCLERKR